jgi:salicylate hydroxylase
MDRPASNMGRASIRTQRTNLHSALKSHVAEGTIKLNKKLVAMQNLHQDGVRLHFADGTTTVSDLVVGADGIRSVVRDSAWNDYELKFTGTTIWRVLLPIDEISDLDKRFLTTGWWHGPTTHVYFSPVGEGQWEIAARAWQDPKIHAASKVSWGTPVDNETVESNFTVHQWWEPRCVLTLADMLVGVSPAGEKGAAASASTGMARVCCVCWSGAGLSHGMGEQDRACR